MTAALRWLALLYCWYSGLLEAFLGFLECTGFRLSVIRSHPQSAQQTCESLNIARLREFQQVLDLGKNRMVTLL
jgi:hypothetical protein